MEHPESKMNDEDRKEAYLDLIAQAFMREAIAKLVAEKLPSDLIDKDQLYMHFANNEFLPYDEVVRRIGAEFANFQKLMEQEAEAAFDKLPIKFSGHRLD